MKALETSFRPTAPGNYLIGFMAKYYGDEFNPDFYNAQKEANRTLEAHSFAHFRLDLILYALEVRYNFKTGDSRIKEVLDYVK